MSWLELFQWTGEPGTVGPLIVVAWQLGRMVRRLDRLEQRVQKTEALARTTAEQLTAHARGQHA